MSAGTELQSGMRALLLPAILAGTLLTAADWPQFRGPGSSGVAAADAAPPVEFGPSKRLLWKQSVSLGHSSPAVWGGRIFLTAFERAEKNLERLCVPTRPGAMEGPHAAPAKEIEETHVVSNPATASPAVDADRVYAYFSSYGLMAFKHSGELEWTLPIAMPKTHHGSGASPGVAGDLAIVNHAAMRGGDRLAVVGRTREGVGRQAYA